MEFKIGAGLACMGIAVGLGQWLVPPDTINTQLRSGLVLVALAFFLIGVGFLLHAAWRHYSVKGGTKNQPIEVSNKTKSTGQSTLVPSEQITAHQGHEQVFVGENITVTYLMNFYREPGRTDFQGGLLAKPFIGKWIHISGVVTDISEQDNFAMIHFEGPFGQLSLIHMFFREKSKIQRVLILKPGTEIEVKGTIYEVGKWRVILDNCELVGT